MKNTFLTELEVASSCEAIYLRGLPGLMRRGSADGRVRIVATEGLVKVAINRSMWKFTKDKYWEISARINVGEIVDVQVFNSDELISEEKAERSVIGRALMGGLLFGESGAYIGAASGFRDKKAVKGWFVAVAFERNNLSNIALFHAFGGYTHGYSRSAKPREVANTLYDMIITSRQEFADRSFEATNPVVALTESDNADHYLPGDTVITKLADLKKLLDVGLITQQEHDAKKSEILSRF